MLKLIFSIIIYLFFICIFIVAPLPVQIVVFLIDLFTPDPIPIFDELIMLICIIKKLLTILKVFDFIENHPVISVGLAAFILYLFSRLFFG